MQCLVYLFSIFYYLDHQGEKAFGTSITDSGFAITTTESTAGQPASVVALTIYFVFTSGIAIGLEILVAS